MNETQHDLPILVTGAAGRIGSVGRTVTELLLAREFRVRAQVRTDDERATRLRTLGAEVVVGDLLDIMAVHRAVEGCDRICFAMSVAPTYLDSGCQRCRGRKAPWREGVRQSLPDDRQRDGHLQHNREPAAEAALAGRADTVLVRPAGGGSATNSLHGRPISPDCQSRRHAGQDSGAFWKGQKLGHRRVRRCSGDRRDPR